MKNTITPVILCGGSGTRLWPLSRKSFPKQFVPLIGNKSLLQLTLERVSLLSKNVICVASDEHRFLVADALLWSRVNVYDEQRIGIVSWSRYMTADEVRAPLQALAARQCQASTPKKKSSNEVSEKKSASLKLEWLAQ
jgi:mannose-1-phosphate guanylyltransferase